MTNQMKKFLLVSMVFSWIGLAACLISFFYNGIGYNNVFSYVILLVNIIMSILLTIFYVKAVIEEKKYRRQIFLAKKLLELRQWAILDFYKRYGLHPLYKEGKLLTPDELLQIATKIDEEGKLNPTIYEMLGIDPVLDENGTEIPIVLVLKHLIKKVKQSGLVEIAKKFKGFYLKGSKKEKKAEPKKKAEKKKEASSKKGKKAEKPLFGMDEPVKPPKPEKKKAGGKGGAAKPPKKEDKKEDKKEEVKPQIIKLTNTEIEKEEERKPEKFKSINSMFVDLKDNERNKTKEKSDENKSSYGEFSLE